MSSSSSSSSSSKSLPLSARAKTTALKQPKELFTYTRDIEGVYKYNANHLHDGLSYYYLPDAQIDQRIDLQSGFKKFRQIPIKENMSAFKPFLESIMKYEQETSSKVSGDIITFRGIMTKILSLPYDNQDAFDLVIVPFDDQLFMNFDNEIELKRRIEQEDRTRQTSSAEKYEYLKKCEYSGYKFETVVTIPDTWGNVSRKTIESRSKKQVNNYEQFLSVAKTGIGNCKLILAGEIDCCWDYMPDTSQNLLHYVELKTSHVIETNNQVNNFEKKLFKTWCQCFLMGVTKIIYGFRDDSFILRNVEIYNTEEIPVLFKENPLNQNQSTRNRINCTNALKWYGAVVEWLNDSIDRKDESKSWCLKYNPIEKSFVLSQASSSMNDSLRNGGILLTEEFKQWRRAKGAN